MENKLFHRSVVFASAPIRGHLKVKNQFQIFYDKSLPKPDSIIGDHPLVLEHYYEVSQELIDKLNNGTLSFNEREEITHHQNKSFNNILNGLSVFTPYQFFSYDKKNQISAWFKIFQKGNDESVEYNSNSFWGAKFYSYLPNSRFNKPYFSDLETDEIPLANLNFKVTSSWTEGKVSFPKDIYYLFEISFKLNPMKFEIFESASILFVNGSELYNISYSLSFMAYISCLETIINYEYKNETIENCSSCGQPKYSVSKKFKRFINQYGDINNGADKIAKKLYEIRSSITHRGNLMFGDVIYALTQEEYFELELLNNLKNITRSCLKNWLISGQP